MPEPERTITIRGEAVVPAEPDELRLRLTVSAVHSRQAEALQDVAARSQELEALLTELGVSKPNRITSGLSIREKREWVDDRSEHRGYEASNSVLVSLRDPKVVGHLLEGAVERAEAQVEGPWWHVNGGNPARLEACRQAAQDAKRKAEAYAGAAGLTLGAIGSIRESADTPMGYGMVASSGSGRSVDGIGIEPGRLDVFASVLITFAIER